MHAHSRVLFFPVFATDAKRERDGSNRNYQLHWIKVHQQEIDFLLCRPVDMDPVMAIRITSDAESAARRFTGPDVLDTVLKDIGLACMGLRAQTTYDPLDLRKRIQRVMQTAEARSSAPENHIHDLVS